MADEKKGELTSYSAGVNWLVGLSAAVVGGAFLHYTDIQPFSLGIRMAFFAVVLMFFVAIWAGVNYAFWLFHVEDDRAYRERLITKSKDTTYPEDEREKYKKAADDVKSSLEDANWWVSNVYHPALLWSFPVGLIGAAFLLGAALWTGQKIETDKDKDNDCKCCSRCGTAQTTSVNHFVVVQSAAHRTPSRMQTHTFLLDQDKGDIWMMICGKDGKDVAFQRVKKLDLAGQEEKMGATTPIFTRGTEIK